MKTSDSSSSSSGRISRRTMVKLAVVGVAGLAVGAGGARMFTRMGGGSAPKHMFFTPEEGALLTEICEQIIPRDDTPGATDAGVIHYIDRQLRGRLARHRQAYRAGLESFRRTCTQAYQRPFEQLTADEKVGALRLIEAGKAPGELWPDQAQQDFFRLVCNHTMQGFYGSPRHGGNRGYISYRLLGIPYPQLIGQNR